MNFNTANGLTLAAHVAEIPFLGVDLPIRAYILPSSPCLLSLCQLCLHEGFTFVFASSERPLLVQPDGCVLECFIHDGMPQLDFTQLRRNPKMG